MNEFIAYCGLDCEKCEARIATMNNDDALLVRRRRWSSETIWKPERTSGSADLSHNVIT